MPLEGGTAEKLSGYKAMAIPEGLEGARVQIGAIAPSSEGLWLYETVSGTKYNLPENYSGGEDGKYEYAQEVNLTSLRLVDASTRRGKAQRRAGPRPWRRSRSSPRTWATRCSCPP